MTIQDTVISLAESYFFRYQEAVSRYLDKFPFLVQLLWEVSVKVRHTSTSIRH